MNKRTLSTYIAILVGGIFIGWLFFSGSGEPSDINEHVQEQHTDEEGNIVYTCSMHPNVREDEPGNCPICGMELIPVDNVDENDSEEDPYALTMTATAMKLAEVQTTEVRSEPAIKESRMPGKVTVDERRTAVIPAHFPGRIEKLYLDFTGAHVEQGDPIASVYAPELVSAQKELLEAYERRESNPRLYRAARQKLINWEISETVIDNIIEDGEPRRNFDIHSHRSGYVTTRHVSVGDHIHFAEPIFEVADLSSVWVEFEAYENDLSGLAEGDSVSFTVRSHPGETYSGQITYIDPILEDRLRTATVRAEAENANGDLKPNMLAKGTVSSSVAGGKAQLQVPASAVMWTGERSLVYVENSNSERTSFSARQVLLGQRVGNFYIIKEGLEEGERVVVHGNFMIDSAAQLADKLSMMNPEPGTGANTGGHDHGSMGEESSDKGDYSEHTDMRSEISGAESEAPQEFRDQLKSAIEVYLELKNALVEDDAELASKSAQNLLEELENMDMTLLDQEQHNRWMELKETLNGESENIVEAQDIDDQREAFFPLSESLIESVREFGVDGVLYYQYCPMANDNDGAYWLSEEEEIRNPYQGEDMLGCGETIEEIEF
ncbi:efflux RND transporter periplasmic adaptor subunit [Aliifodinibius salipaludis]|nr:efflux RND transporter periplasmic adaptor subunit [Aliifodinibius salipaludis]